MACKAELLFLALYALSAFGSIYHGPTATPVVLKSGYLADTHDVATAKGAHLAALARESHYRNGGDYSESYSHGNDYLSYSDGKAVQYHGPTAKPVVLKSGYLADTHEVAAAKSAHLAAITKQTSYGQVDHSSGSYTHEVGYDNSFVHDRNIKYHGPTAVPHVLKNGHVADTHEVAAAKADHYAAVANAQTHDGHGNSYVYTRHQ